MAGDYKQLACRDGGADCDSLVRAETEAEVIDVVTGHLGRVHGYAEVPPAMAAQLRGIVRTVAMQPAAGGPRS